MNWPAVPLILIGIVVGGLFALLASPKKRAKDRGATSNDAREVGVAILPILLTSHTMESLSRRARELGVPVGELLTAIVDDSYDTPIVERAKQLVFGSVHDDRGRSCPLHLSSSAAESLGRDAAALGVPPNARFSRVIEAHFEEGSSDGDPGNRQSEAVLCDDEVTAAGLRNPR